MQKISPALFWKQFATFNLQLRSHTSFLPTNLAMLSALVPNFVRKTQRKTKQRWTTRYKDARVLFAAAKAAGVALQKRLRATAVGRILGRGQEISTSKWRTHRTWELSWHQRALHWYLFAHRRSMARTDIHTLGYKTDLFSHHALQRLGVFTRVTLATAFRQNVHELPQYRAAVPFHVCSQREGRKKKETTDLDAQRESGMEPRQQVVPTWQRDLSWISSCLGSGEAQQQQLTPEYQFPHD